MVGAILKVRYSRAISTLGCPTLGLRQVLELAAQHGIAGVELRALAASTDLPKYFAEAESSGMRPLELSVANDVAVLSLNSSCALIGGAETEWAQLAAFGQLADRLTVPWVRVFDGSSAGETDLSLAWTALDRWRKLRRRFKWKTALLVETHGILANAEAIMRFLGGAPDVGLLWDSHYTWLCGEDPVTTWQAIGARVERIHVKDSLRCHDAPGGCEYVLPGTGEFPMNRLGPILEREFSGAVTLEWEKLWHPEIPSLEAALASARARGWW